MSWCTNSKFSWPTQCSTFLFRPVKKLSTTMTCDCQGNVQTKLSLDPSPGLPFKVEEKVLRFFRSFHVRTFEKIPKNSCAFFEASTKLLKFFPTEKSKFQQQFHAKYWILKKSIKKNSVKHLKKYQPRGRQAWDDRRDASQRIRLLQSPGSSAYFYNSKTSLQESFSVSGRSSWPPYRWVFPPAPEFLPAPPGNPKFRSHSACLPPKSACHSIPPPSHRSSSFLTLGCSRPSTRLPSLRSSCKSLKLNHRVVKIFVF